LQGHTEDVGSVAFNRDGSRLVTTAEDDRTIVWDTESGRNLLDVAGAAGDAFGASFSPDGTRIAVGSNVGRPVRIIDALSGKVLQMLRFSDTGLCGPEFSPDGSRVTAAACFGDNHTIVWDLASGEVVMDLPGGGMSAVYNAAGTRILTAEGSVLDARTGRRLLTLGGFSGAILGTAWSADGTMIATGGSDGIARVWDAETGSQVFELAGHAGLVAMVDFSPDGTRLVTGGGDGTARVWDISPTGGAEAFAVAQRFEINGVAYSGDGSKLLLTGWDFNGTWLLDPANGRRLRSYRNLYGRGAFGPGATTVVGAGCFDDLCPAPAVLDTATGKRLQAFDAKDWQGFRPLEFGPRATVATVQEDNTVKMWSVESGQLLRTFGSPSSLPGVVQEDLTFSPNGQLLAGIDTRAVVRVWRVSTGAEVLTFRAHTGLAHAIAFSPDGSLLATSAGDGAAVWNASTGKRIQALAGSGTVNEIAFSGDGAHLATAGDDGRATVWDVASGRELMKLGSNPGGLSGLAFNPDGTRLAVTGNDGRLRVFLLRTADLIRVARSRLTRGFTEGECRQYLHVASCPSSLRIASRPPPDASGPPPRNGPEGAFRVTIRAGDLPTGVFSEDDVKGIIGDYTLSLVGGTWRTYQVHPDFTFGTSGTYSVSGDRITFTDEFDPGCFGWRWSARWSADEMSLTFVDSSPVAGSVCPALPGPQGPALLAGVFDSRAWARVAHHEKGG
jgi:WD40 repeat protein